MTENNEAPEVEVLPPEDEPPSNPFEDNSVLHFGYAMLVGGFFTMGLTTIIAMIIGYVKRHEDDAFAFSHLTWIIRSGWIAIIGGGISFLLMLTIILSPIAMLLGGIMMIWNIFRIFKGWSLLLNKAPILKPYDYI